MSDTIKITDSDALAHILGGANSAVVLVTPVLGKMIDLNIVKDGVVSLFGVSVPASAVEGALQPGTQYIVAKDGVMTLDANAKTVIPPKTVGCNKSRCNSVQYRKS